MLIYDRFGLDRRANCVHVVGMSVHMLAKVGLLIVVACLRFVNACSFICVSFIDLVEHVSTLYMLFACCCT